MRRFEKSIEWKELTREDSGKISLRRVIDRGIERTSKKRGTTNFEMTSRKNGTTKKKNIVDGKNTQELKAKNSVKINLKLNFKTCLTTPTRKKVVTPVGKNSTIVTVGSTDPPSEHSVEKISGRFVKDASLKNLEDNQLVQARRKINPEINPFAVQDQATRLNPLGS